jgi:hypothetical protein
MIRIGPHSLVGLSINGFAFAAIVSLVCKIAVLTKRNTATARTFESDATERCICCFDSKPLVDYNLEFFRQVHRRERTTYAMIMEPLRRYEKILKTQKGLAEPTFLMLRVS